MLNFDFVLRLLVGGILGAIIGLDREYRAKEAGYRTHFLVSLGSALIMIVSQYGFQEIIKESSVTLDPSRVAAQVVSGIGFIGAGTIIFQKQIVRGLTTAAGIWATAGIGLAVGAGMYTISIAATLLTLAGLELLSLIFKSIGMKSSVITFSTSSKEILPQVSRRFNSKDYLVVSYNLDRQVQGEYTNYQVTMVIKSKKSYDEGYLLQLMQEFPEVTVEKIEKNEDNGTVSINGGIEEGGVDLWRSGDIYRTVTYDDYPVYYMVGELVLPMDENITLSDSSSGVDAASVETNGTNGVASAVGADLDSWTEYNTTVSTTDGKVSNILRIWVP